MNLSERYIEERIVERGILMAVAPKDSAATTTTPVGSAVWKTTESVLEIIRPALTAPRNAAELDGRIDELLFDDTLFDLFADLSLCVGFQLVDDVISGDEAVPGIEGLVGGFCAKKVTLLFRENAKALIDLVLHSRNHPSPRPDSPKFPGQTLLRPSLYVGHRLLPAEMQRALLGRDIGQIVFAGVVRAAEWNLGVARTVELCERFIDNQSRWLELLSVLPGVAVREDVLPAARTDFRAAWQATCEANLGLDRAREFLDKTGQTSYFFVEREFDDAGCGQKLPRDR